MGMCYSSVTAPVYFCGVFPKVLLLYETDIFTCLQRPQSAAFLSSLTEECLIISYSRAAVMGCASKCRPSMYQVPGKS